MLRLSPEVALGLRQQTARPESQTLYAVSHDGRRKRSTVLENAHMILVVVGAILRMNDR